MSDIDVRPLARDVFSVSTAVGLRLAWAIAAGPEVWVYLDGHVHVMPAGLTTGRRRGPDDEVALSAPMPATVVGIAVKPGQKVVRGDVMIRLEAMKMEFPITAPRDARVKSVSCREGDLVQSGVPLVELEPERVTRSENSEG